MRSTRLFVSSSVLTVVGLLATSAVGQELTPRETRDLHGDFQLFGNTLGYECAASRLVTPLLGTVDCSDAVEPDDYAPDLFWRSDYPNEGEAFASVDVGAGSARSTAVLELPEGATAVYARLYWAGWLEPETSSADAGVTLECPGREVEIPELTADDSATVAKTINDPTDPAGIWYQSGVDITQWVTRCGPGAYRVSGVDARDFPSAASQDLLAGWWVVVLYEAPGEPMRNLAIFDGLHEISDGSPETVNLSGFKVPNAGFDAKLGVVTYEGDPSLDGDTVLFGNPPAIAMTPLSNDQNPEENFSNGSRSWLGEAVNLPGDMPRMSGEPGSMSGIDLDVFDVEGLVVRQQETAQIEARSDFEYYVLGAFITSISTYKPSFSQSTKMVADLYGGGLRPGDELVYTLFFINTGNDVAVDAVVTDPLSTKVTFVPGSLEVSGSGDTWEGRSDERDGDTAEYDPDTRTVTARVGSGADASVGGRIPIGVSQMVRFHVTVNADATGTISNQAVISAGGGRGAPVEPFPTGNGGDNDDPTDIIVDECSSNAECSAPTPYCDPYSDPRVCVECYVSSQCTGAAAPDCINHVCVCVGGDCVDSDGDGLSDGAEQELGSDPLDWDSDDDGVPDGSEPQPGADTNQDGEINVLDPDSDGDGIWDGTEMGYDCDTNPDTDLSQNHCVPDADEGDETTNPLDPDTDDGGVSDGNEDDNHNGEIDEGETDPNDPLDDDVDYSCGTDADCGNLDSGMVCSTGICVPGCRGEGGNGCPAGLVCTSTDMLIGDCVEEQPGTGGAGGEAGQAGSAGNAGSAGSTAGTAGVAGQVEQGGNAGTVEAGGGGEIAGAGTGPGGTSGMAGAAGSDGGTAGTAGQAVAGTAGEAGTTGGTAGAAGGAGLAGAGAAGESGTAGEAAGQAGEAGSPSGTAGSEPEAGSGEPAWDGEYPVMEGGGCSCGVANTNTGRFGWLLLTAAGLGLSRRRKNG